MSEPERPKTNGACGQCGKPAIAQVSEVPLCVDCYAKFQNANAAELNARLQMMRHEMAMANHAIAQMDAMVPLTRGPYIDIPPMPSSSPVTLNNIKVDNSTVGSLNTGVVRDLDVTLSRLHTAGLDDLRKAIANLSQAVLDTKELTTTQRDELLERIEFLSSQMSATNRKPGMIKGAINAIATAASNIKSVADAWSACEPILKGIFGL